MAVKLGEALVEVKVDISNLKKGMSDALSEVKRDTVQLESEYKRNAQASNRVYVAMSKAAQAAAKEMEREVTRSAREQARAAAAAAKQQEREAIQALKTEEKAAKDAAKAQEKAAAEAARAQKSAARDAAKVALNAERQKERQAKETARAEVKAAVSAARAQMAEADKAAKAAIKAERQKERQARDSADAVGNAWIGSLKSIAAAIAVYVGVNELVDGIKAVTIASNNATETQNKFEVAFRTARGEAEKSLTAFSKLAGGLNVYALKEYASGFQLLFNAMELAPAKTSEMSTELAKLSYDLASLYNSSIDEAFTRLQSGLVGETEAVRRFGVDVSEAALRQELLRQGIDKNFESLSQAEKVMLRYNMIMRQTRDAQGDLARTQNTGANVMRRFSEQFERMKIELGQGFRNVIEMVGPQFLAFISKIDFRKVAAQIATVAQDLYRHWKPAFEEIVRSVHYMIDAFREVGPALAKITASNTIALIAASVIALSRAIGGVLYMIKALAIAWANTMQWMLKSTRSVIDIFGRMTLQQQKMQAWIVLIDKSVNLLDNFKNAFNDQSDVSGSKWIQDILKGFQEASPLADKMRESFPDNSAYREEAEAINEIMKARRDDMKAEMERRQQAIGFIQGRDVWEKGAVTGERQRFAATSAQSAGSNAGAALGITNAEVQAAYNAKQAEERIKSNRINLIAEMLARYLPEMAGQNKELGYGL